MTWELPILTTLILSVLGFWWLYSPQSRAQKTLYALLCAGTLLIDPSGLLQHMYAAGYDALVDVRLDVLLLQHFKMVLTLGAVVWLLHRSWQTLWKPVPDLINILGVDVPESPDVSLAGIRADAATLSWTRPPSNRPVQKYSIQVNGVHVGESPGNEVAITVTGLKPNHFYNIRVVAVGPNNFQAGSPVVRLRTFGKDGKPQLGNSRLPTSFSDHDHYRVTCDDENDDSDTRRHPVPSVEAAPVLDGNSTVARDTNNNAPGQRRNTVNRRHSPSVASMEPPQIRPPTADGPELSLDELNRKFEGIRKEIDDTLSLYAKDEAEFQQQEEELKKEKERKRQALKEKEEQTMQLKAMMRSTMEQMRAAEKERAKKDQQLKDKETKKAKVRDSITKLENDIERMKKDREGFESQKIELEKKRDDDVRKLDDANAELQEKCAELEAELKDKGKQLQDMKAAREELPGGDDEQWKESDAQTRRDWDAKRKELHNQLVAETKKGHQLDQHLRLLSEQLSIQSQSGLAYFNQPDPTALEFDPSSSTPLKRQSQTSNSLGNVNMPSPPDHFAMLDTNFQASTGFSRTGFAPGLFMDMSADGPDEPPTEAELKASAGPLSPTAHSLLPSGIFDDAEGPEARQSRSPFIPDAIAAGDDDPQSPASSAQSRSLFSSPQGSSHNLPFPQYTDHDGRSLHLNSSPAAPPATGHRLTNLLSTFQRNRGTRPPADEGGPPIGTLKAGQSQSFPRGTDEHDFPGSKRRLSFSWMNRHSTVEARASPVAPSKSLSTRRLNPFASSAGALMSERDPLGSRPPSISSSDLPRPSTDSGSIWGLPGDVSSLAKNRFWSPNENRWASRSNSRRPSIHGSPAVLTTTLASADDEILDDDDLMDPQTSPSQIGVIGSRPPGHHHSSMSQRLNPAAPTFMGNLFRRDNGVEREKAKAKEKDRQKDKAKDAKGKGKEVHTPTAEAPYNIDDSPTDSRVSRDGYSVCTPSVSESHESLPLDLGVPSSPLDLNAAHVKDPENVVKKLFRKGSSSKFSFSSRLGKESGLFKKGPGSATYSEKNMSAEHRSSIGDLDDLGEDVSQLGRSYDSMASSPSLGPPSSKGKDPREGRMSTWRFSIMKKGKDVPVKEKESQEMDVAPEDDWVQP